MIARRAITNRDTQSSCQRRHRTCAATAWPCSSANAWYSHVTGNGVSRQRECCAQRSDAAATAATATAAATTRNHHRETNHRYLRAVKTATPYATHVACLSRLHHLEAGEELDTEDAEDEEDERE